MANPDARFGLRPVRHIDGSPWNGGTIRCYIGAAYTSALYVGDPVDITDELDDRVAGITRVLTVRASTFVKTAYVMGVIISFEPLADNPNITYHPASTAQYCNVCVDPTVVYWIRDNGAAALTNVVIGQNADGILTHGGDTITGLSGAELDAGTTTAPAADSTYMMLVVGCADTPDIENAWDGSTDTHVVWEVILTSSRLFKTNGAGALGVTAT
jgi:hypothetical protein